MRRKWNSKEMELKRIGIGRDWNEQEIGMSKKWNEEEMERARNGMNKKWKIRIWNE